MFQKQAASNLEVRRTATAKIVLAIVSLALVAAGCGSGETIGSRGGVDDVTAASSLDQTNDDTTVDDSVADDGTDTSGDAESDSSAVEGTEVEGTEVEGTEVEGTEPDGTDDEQADSPGDGASGPNTKLLTEPQTSAQIQEILNEIAGDGGLEAANKFTFFPEVPIPDGARFFGYEADVTIAPVGGGAIGQTKFEYFFDGTLDEVEAAFFADMEAAGWDMSEVEDVDGHYEVLVPSRQFDLDLRLFDASYRGSTLAILRFSVNGEAYEDVGNLEVWEGLTEELGILTPESAIPAGGGAMSYREESENEQSNPLERTGDFVTMIYRPGESGDLTEYMEAFATYAEGQGYQATIGSSEMSLIKDGEATTYVFDWQGIWITKELK